MPKTIFNVCNKIEKFTQLLNVWNNKYWKNGIGTNKHKFLRGCSWWRENTSKNSFFEEIMWEKSALQFPYRPSSYYSHFVLESNVVKYRKMFIRIRQNTFVIPINIYEYWYHRLLSSNKIKIFLFCSFAYCFVSKLLLGI